VDSHARQFAAQCPDKNTCRDAVAIVEEVEVIINGPEGRPHGTTSGGDFPFPVWSNHVLQPFQWQNLDHVSGGLGLSFNSSLLEFLADFDLELVFDFVFAFFLLVFVFFIMNVG